MTAAPQVPLPQLIVGNLDFEDPQLPSGVRRAISAAATLLQVFAEPGACLWTPAPVDAGRVVDCRVKLVSGPLPPAATVVAWAETELVRAARRGSAAAIPSPEIVRRVNHRAFAFALAQQLGLALPGAQLIDDLAQLRPNHDSWVVKAPMSAAGRGRLRRRGRELDPAGRVRAERLLRRHGQLLYEPWMERTGDFACLGTVSERGLALAGCHHLITDRQGGFRGITITPDLVVPGLDVVAGEVARALSAAGYRGPFGIDGYRYIDSTGRERLQLLSEINARYTFGHVARALAEAYGRPRLTLRLATAPEPIAADATVLLRPASDDPTTAWLEPPTR
jgi:hypothetical protein